MVTPSEVDNRVTDEAEIEQSVKGLNGGRADGPSGMQAEDLKGWSQEASREKNLVRRWWRLLSRLIQRMFEDGVLPEEVAWSKMVLLPKGM